MTVANVPLSSLALGLALVLPACTSERPPAPPGRDVPAGTAAVMSEHFAASLEIKDAVILGDLVGVRAPARRLLDDPDAYPRAWRPFVAQNVQLAAAARDSADLQGAARVAAELANTCGECHVALARGPHFSTGRPPRAAADGVARRRMIRHQWAADRMWEALVSHDDAAWRAGAATLSGDILTREQLGLSAAVPDATIALQRHITELGERAAAAASWPTRTRLYGDFLASCAGCHTRAL